MAWVLGSPYGIELAVQSAADVNRMLAQQRMQSLQLQQQRDAATLAAKQRMYDSFGKITDKFNWNIDIGKTPAEIEREKDRDWRANERAQEQTWRSGENEKMRSADMRRTAEAYTDEPYSVSEANARDLGIPIETYLASQGESRRQEIRNDQIRRSMLSYGYPPEEVDAYLNRNRPVYDGAQARDQQYAQAVGENSQLAALQGQPVDLQSMNPVPQPNAMGQDFVGNAPMLMDQRQQQNYELMNRFAELQLSDTDKNQWRDWANMESKIDSDPSLDPIRKAQLKAKIDTWRQGTTQKWVPRENPVQDKAAWIEANSVDLGPNGTFVPSVSPNGVPLRPNANKMALLQTTIQGKMQQQEADNQFKLQQSAAEQNAKMDLEMIKIVTEAPSKGLDPKQAMRTAIWTRKVQTAMSAGRWDLVDQLIEQSPPGATATGTQAAPSTQPAGEQSNSFTTSVLSMAGSGPAPKAGTAGAEYLPEKVGQAYNIGQNVIGGVLNSPPPPPQLAPTYDQWRPNDGIRELTPPPAATQPTPTSMNPEVQRQVAMQALTTPRPIYTDPQNFPTGDVVSADPRALGNPEMVNQFNQQVKPGQIVVVGTDNPLYFEVVLKTTETGRGKAKPRTYIDWVEIPPDVAKARIAAKRGLSQ